MTNALGYVTETETGFEGALNLISPNAPIRIVRNGEKTVGTRICLADPCRPVDRPAQDLRESCARQRRRRPSRHPLESTELTARG